MFSDLISTMENSLWFSVILYVMILIASSGMNIANMIFVFFTFVLRNKIINLFSSKDEDVIRIS